MITPPGDHHGALKALDDAPADEVADREEVVRRTGDDLPGRVQVVERPREAQVAGVEQLPQAGLEADAHARSGVSASEVDPETDDRDREDRNHVGPERTRVLGHDGVVDHALHQHRHGQREGRVAERAPQADEHQPPLFPPQVGEAAHGWAQGVVLGIELVHGETPPGGRNVRPDQRLPAALPAA